VGGGIKQGTINTIKWEKDEGLSVPWSMNHIMKK